MRTCRTLGLLPSQLGRGYDDGLGAGEFVDGRDANLLAELHELEENALLGGGRTDGCRVRLSLPQASEKLVMPCASNW